MLSRTTLVIGTVDKLVLGCFFGLAFAASVGCVPKSAKKCWKVRESEKKCGKVRFLGKNALSALKLKAEKWWQARAKYDWIRIFSEKVQIKELLNS